MSSFSLSVAMIVNNEEQFIEKVIQNVQPISDEIIITDTGSTGNTVDIIKKYKVKLLHYKWNGNESSARNFTLSKCNTDWILFIDADEFIDIKDYQKILRLIKAKNKFIAYRVILRHYFNPHITLENLYNKGWSGSYSLHSIIRIFKNRESIFYSQPVYPSVTDSLRDRVDKVGNSGVVFHHLDILRNKQKKIEKRKWYNHNVFENFRKNPDRPETNYMVAHYYQLQGEFRNAIKHYQRALKFNPKHIKSKLSLGLSFVISGKEKEGLRLIKECRGNNNVFLQEPDSYLKNAYEIVANHMLKKKGNK